MLYQYSVNYQQYNHNNKIHFTTLWAYDTGRIQIKLLATLPFCFFNLWFPVEKSQKLKRPIGRDIYFTLHSKKLLRLVVRTKCNVGSITLITLTFFSQNSSSCCSLSTSESSLSCKNSVFTNFYFISRKPLYKTSKWITWNSTKHSHFLDWLLFKVPQRTRETSSVNFGIR